MRLCLLLCLCWIGLPALASRAMLLDGASYVPLRAITEWLGGEIGYDAAQDEIVLRLPASSATAPPGIRYVDLECGPLVVRLRPNSAEARLEEPTWMAADPDAYTPGVPVRVPLTAAPIVRNGTAYLPSRALSVLRMYAEWDGTTRQVIIHSARAEADLLLDTI